MSASISAVVIVIILLKLISQAQTEQLSTAVGRNKSQSVDSAEATEI